MRTSPRVEKEFEFKRPAPRKAARCLWSAVRLPLVAALTLLEPAVRYLCSIAMVLGVFASVMFEISAAGPRFPFLGMLGLSLGFGVVLFLYYGLMALLSR
jgi:hypothetical protein